MKSYWKCKICEKVLASKQNIEKHLVKLHPGSDQTQYTVVQVTHDEDKSAKKQTKPKSAYSFFSGMQNIFSHTDMCKDLTLYPPNKGTANENIQDKNNVQDDKAPSELSSSFCKDTNSPLPSMNSKTTSDGSDLFLGLLDTAFEESPPPTPDNSVVSTGPPDVIDQNDKKLPTKPTSSVRFKPPFKPRGGCGCENCNRDNCGKCFNCLNRSKLK